MRLFQYIYYFFRSLYYRGLLNTFKLLRYEKRYEEKLGISTHSIVNLDGLTLAGDNNSQNHHYQGASYYILFLTLNILPEELKNKPFIDFGCGKGRALFVAEQCGFTDLTGVDIAQELIYAANANKLKYIPLNPQSRFNFVFSDATRFPIPEKAAVFYFFNPFGENILQKVISNIKESVTKHPRNVICIYLNPKYKAVFEQNGFRKTKEIKSWRYLEGIIYEM